MEQDKHFAEKRHKHSIAGSTMLQMKLTKLLNELSLTHQINLDKTLDLSMNSNKERKIT